MDGILDIRFKIPKLLKIIIFGAPLVSPIPEKITDKDTPEFKYVDYVADLDYEDYNYIILQPAIRRYFRRSEAQATPLTYKNYTEL